MGQLWSRAVGGHEDTNQSPVAVAIRDNNSQEVHHYCFGLPSIQSPFEFSSISSSWLELSIFTSPASSGGSTSKGRHHRGTGGTSALLGCQVKNQLQSDCIVLNTINITQWFTGCSKDSPQENWLKEMHDESGWMKCPPLWQAGSQRMRHGAAQFWEQGVGKLQLGLEPRR